MRRLLLALGLGLALLPGAPALARRAPAAPHGPAPRPLSFPADTASHPATNVEWWYFVGHLVDHTGHGYGFETTFFRFSGLRRYFPGSPVDTAFRTDVAITDEAKRRFHHGITYVPAMPPLTIAGTRQLHLRAGAITVRTLGPQHYAVHGAMSDGAVDLDLTSLRQPMLVNGGFVGWGTGWSYYYSLTRMRATGTIVLGKRHIRVQGLAWHDHQWGDMQNGALRGWDWMEMQLDDHTDVSLIVERTVNPNSPDARWAMALLPDATQRYVPGVQLTALGRWRSPVTGFIYPSGWRMHVPALQLDVTVTPTVRDQEMWDPFAVMGYHSSYWEGSCTVVGTRAGHRVTGHGYTELTGYGSRPPSPQH